MRDRFIKVKDRELIYKPKMYAKRVVPRSKCALICGSRDWEDYDMIFNEISNLQAQGYEEIIEGGAEGADTFARQAAKKLGMKIKTVYAEWGRYGKSAGFLRNKRMIEMCPDIVVAFQKNKSRGTQLTIDLAKKKGIKTVVYDENI